jgi:chromosomal replication initiation ATPase DnaA
MGKASFIRALANGYRRGTPLAAARAIAEKVCADHQISMEELRGPSRLIRYVRARRDAIAAMHAKGFSLHQMGETLNRDHTTIVHHLQFLGLTYRVDKS